MTPSSARRRARGTPPLRPPARSGCVPLARLRAADGVIAGLGLLTAATLLKMIELRTWTQIALFAVTLGLRTLLKRLFIWERRQILAREPGLRPLGTVP